MMLQSPIDSEKTEVRTDTPVSMDVTHFLINGPIFELEGYLSIENLQTFVEDRIRKTLIIKPLIDIEAYRKELKESYINTEEEEEELSDEEIIDAHTLKIPIDNCQFTSVKNYEESDIKEYDSLAGFKVNLDLSSINGGKPLEKGEYHLYIHIEQLMEGNDDVKHVKTVPLAKSKANLGKKIMTANLYHFSGSLYQRYKLIISFDALRKTIRFENTLLQSYDPREFNIEDGGKREGRYALAFKRRFFKLLYYIFYLLPVNRKKVTFASDSRTDLTGNLFFIYEEMYRRKMDLNIKFMFNERIDNKKSIFNLIKTAFHFATSKIILLDDFYPFVYPLRIKRKTELIQVWHAAGAFKTFGFSRLGRPGGPSPHSKNHRNYTKATVSSEGVRAHYAEGFGISLDKVHATGVPRSDIFFDEEYKQYVTERLYTEYPYLKDKKVILFAPTFRGNGQASAHFPFHMLNLKTLYEELSDEYVFVFKNHPFVNNELTIPYEYSDFFYDLSDFREINDLLFVTDVLITDYSSVCFEFALLNKPTLFFAFDIEEYIRSRDFYYDYFEFIPGPIVRTTKEIVRTIKEEDFQMEKIRPFINYFFNDTLGKASKNVVDDVIIPSLESDGKEIVEEKVTLEPPKSRLELFERSFNNNEEEQ